MRPDHRAAESPELLTIARDDESDLITIDRLTVRIDHNQPIAITIECDAEISPCFAHGSLQHLRRSCTHARVNVEAIGSVTDRGDRCTQLLQHRWGDVVGRAMRAVHHNFKARQIDARIERALTKFDVTPSGVGHAMSLAKFARSRGFEWLIELSFDRRFNVIWKFMAGGGKKFDAVVVKRIV